jgi:Protein of unknown function (DUF3575)
VTISGKQYTRNIIAKGLVLTFIVAISVTDIMGQSGDSTIKHERNFKNTIKLNVTSNIIYKNALLFGYERVISKNQSLNLSGGYMEFPLSLDLNLLGTKLEKAKTNSGYAVGFEYRFYLKGANKCLDAPRGVYLAPFIAYQHFQSERLLSYTHDSLTASTDLKSSINLLNIGGELGYQFVLWKRFVIDVQFFAPALTHYNFNAKLASELQGLDSNEALQAFIDALKEKYPKLKDLTGQREVSKSGTESFWSVGFRYKISFGFRF